MLVPVEGITLVKKCFSFWQNISIFLLFLFVNVVFKMKLFTKTLNRNRFLSFCFTTQSCNCRKTFFRGLNSPVLLILFCFVSFCFVLFCFVAPHFKKQFSFRFQVEQRKTFRKLKHEEEHSLIGVLAYTKSRFKLTKEKLYSLFLIPEYQMSFYEVNLIYSTIQFEQLFFQR